MEIAERLREMLIVLIQNEPLWNKLKKMIALTTISLCAITMLCGFLILTDALKSKSTGKSTPVNDLHVHILNLETIMVKNPKFAQVNLTRKETYEKNVEPMPRAARPVPYDDPSVPDRKKYPCPATKPLCYEHADCGSGRICLFYSGSDWCCRDI